MRAVMPFPPMMLMPSAGGETGPSSANRVDGAQLVSMFVPVLGEVMMVAMAGQLLYANTGSAIEWGEAIRKRPKPT